MNVDEIFSQGVNALLQGDQTALQNAYNLLKTHFPQSENCSALVLLVSTINADANQFEAGINEWRSYGGSPNTLTQKGLRLLLNQGYYENLIRLWQNYPVTSTGQCNTRIKSICWRFKFQCFSGPFI